MIYVHDNIIREYQVDFINAVLTIKIFSFTEEMLLRGGDNYD